ncbi:pentapeptide repeat-containing protein [Echinicola soli]|uniref:Pentapeptide repeat-containing protein n=1 Tax=Echinicola soli TaxID=2591634 RepID=A0A514CF72_9BACT|nr:pentapeptide repeat-containing protein [Echinicola soli]QDH78473.1 pentapeptide repeat-containing protein [Echinicola soli]
MKTAYFDGKEFRDEDFRLSFTTGEYEECTFVGCTFAGSDLRDVVFSECNFERCDLSNAQLQNTSLRDIEFSTCKLLGLRFDKCNPFLLTITFTDCQLDFSSFYGLKLKQTKFKSCRMHEVEFVEVDLTASTFDGCDLFHAVFDGACLEKVDFSTAENFSIDPESNQIKKAKFSLSNVTGLLDKYDISVR